MSRHIHLSCLLMRSLFAAIVALTLAVQAQAIEVLTATGESFTQDPANARFYRNEFGGLQHVEFQKQVPYFDDVDYARAKQATPATQEKARLMEDILRIQRIVQSPPTFLNSLRSLNAAAVQIHRANIKLDAHVALEQALFETEEAHFFPTERIVALDALSDLEFLKTVSEGRILNDIGPGVRHGEYSHRLQWAAIMAKYDENPKAWNYPPYELYTRIGEAELDRTAKNAGRYGVWLTLFDMQGQALLRAPDGSVDYGLQPTDGMKLVRDGFRHPDRLGSLFGIPSGFMNQTRTDVAGATPADIAEAKEFNTRDNAIEQGAEMDNLYMIEFVVRARYNQRLLGAFDAFRASGEPQYVILPKDENFEAYIMSLAAGMVGTGEFTPILASDDPRRPKLVLMQDDYYLNMLTTMYPRETKSLRRLAARAARDEPGAAIKWKTEMDALDKKIVTGNLANPDANFIPRLKQAFSQVKGQLSGKPRRAGRPKFVPVLAFPEGEFDNLSKEMNIPIQEYMKPNTNPVNGALLTAADGKSSSTTKTRTKIRNKEH